jgi:MFS family permease
MLYGAIVFLSSAVVMVLEIAAGRLIAPYVGVSLYSWTSVIGVVLAGLAIGNWAGGRWADAGAADREAGLALAGAALATLGVLLALTLIAPLVQSRPMGLMTASFLLAAGLFFVPAACLGIVAPMLTTLALGLDRRAGHVVGRMHALAALGSIAGTFVTGFLLIQFLGTRSVIVGAGIGLLVLSLPLLRGMAMAAAIAAAALVLGSGLARQGLEDPCDTESQYFCIRVVDFSGSERPGDTRTLVLDHLIHGISHGPNGTLLFAPYAQLMDELARRHMGDEASSGRYFFAGGGSYAQPRATRLRYPDAVIDVAELDPAVTHTARRQLFLDDDSMGVRHTDARVALSSAARASYNVIVGDVFHDVAVPYHLTTSEYAALVRSRLTDDGLYVLNVVDAFPDPLLVKSVVRTLAEHFPQVDVWLDQIPVGPSRATYIISARNRQSPWPRVVKSGDGLARSWLRVTETVANTGTVPESLPVLTDDFVPVERLVSRLLLKEIGNL